MPHGKRTQRRLKAKDLKKEFNPPMTAAFRRKMPKDKDASVRLQRDS